MKREWQNLDINQLQGLYQHASQQLERQLLRGARWKQVTEQRKEVTELAIVIYNRLNPTYSANPAENSRR